jgi:hypothetical protein
MPRKSYKPEEIVAKLRQVDVLISQGQSTPRSWSKAGGATITLNAPTLHSAIAHRH